MSPSRRQVLKWGGIGLGTLAGVGGTGAALLWPPQPSTELAPFSELAVRVFDSLADEERSEAVFDYDHPLRQYHNRGVDTGGAWIIGLGRETRQLLIDLVYSGLSPSGRGRIFKQLALDWAGLQASRLAIFGDPRNPPYQIIISGAHHNIRLGGTSREGVAFGGPQVYGDQNGNGKLGLPGNAYRDQLELGQQLIAMLSPGEHATVRQAKSPVQTAIELQGANGVFAGIAVANLNREKRAKARGLVASILASYGNHDVAYAWECIEHNGGVDALHLADYAKDYEADEYDDGQDFGDGPSQVFRLEGPAALLYFRGSPHLHAFINIGMDGDNPLSVGEVVGVNPAPLERAGVKSLFEEALLSQTEADLAFFPARSFAGRLRAGTIRTGDLYNLESWRERAHLVEIKGADLSRTLQDSLAARGDSVRSNNTYRVATTGYVVERRADEWLGRFVLKTRGEMLRDITIAHLKSRGFPAPA